MNKRDIYQEQDQQEQQTTETKPADFLAKPLTYLIYGLLGCMGFLILTFVLKQAWGLLT